MSRKRKQRIYSVVSIVLGVFLAVGLSLYALSQNINLYYTPKQLRKHQIPMGREFRLGGVVAKGSLHRVQNSLAVRFVVTDFHHHVTVYYRGLLPALFREGQGIVTQGKLAGNGIFIADQVLAKHDATYRPPGIKL